MDQKLSQLFPITKRTVDLINIAPLQSNETPRQLYERVIKAMESGGIGTRADFKLDWDRLSVILTIKSLPSQIQDDLLSKYDTLEVDQVQLQRFLDTKSQQKYMAGRAINTITKPTKPPTPPPHPSKELSKNGTRGPNRFNI